MPTISTPTTVQVATNPANTRSFDNLASDFGVGLRLDLPIGPSPASTTAFRSRRTGTAAAGKFNFNVGYQF